MALRRWLPGWAVLSAITLAGCGGKSVSAPSVPQPVENVAPGTAAAPEAELKKAPRLRISPETLTLGPGDLGFQLTASLSPDPDSRLDLTDRVTWRVEQPGVLNVDRGGYLVAVGPGRATVHALHDGEDVKADVTIEPATEQRPWSFATDIVPLFTHAGCNTGGCHGRADGQNGFHLSLFGYDAQADYQAITHDAGGRRFSRLNPTASLLLAKAAGTVPHTGGQRLKPGTESYTTLVAWLKAGAPESLGKSHGALTGVKVEPADARLDGPGTQQLRVLASYQDGHTRDVTRLALFRSNDDSALTITPKGKAKLLRRAEADLVVRFQNQVVSTRLASVINPELVLDFAKLERKNFIDDELYMRLAALKVPPSPPASDAVFLRRITLDLTGEQPQPQEIRKFLADTDPEKRAKLVDHLTASKEFVLFWKIKFGDLLQITKTRFGNGSSYYHTWLQEQIQTNAPWDQSVRTLLTALGNPMEVGGGAVNYALDGPDAKTQAEQTAQRFLALRLRCAQCHDHPFDIWTQDDYYGLAAFFAKVQRGAAMMSGRVEVKLNPKGEVEHLRTKKPVAPRLLDGKAFTIKDGEDPRKNLAQWITSPDNPYFARATANWVWAQFFGKGIADPPDDLSRANPPVHPELLDALAKNFVEHKYDIRALIRAIATSRAYGASSGTIPGNEKDTRLFSHQLPRPLTAHQMADALAQATSVPNPFADQGRTVRLAIEIYDPSTASTILDTFGRCPRTVSCSSVSAPPLSLRQSLLLIGGGVIEDKVTSLNGYLVDLLQLNPEPDEIVENLYMRTVCRPPTPEEISRWAAELKQAPKIREAAEDLFWALLNSREFAFNH